MTEEEFLKKRAQRIPMGIGWLAFGALALWTAWR
jgi:hypothetical protein